jgi:SAM-dependent methyltransferase
MMDFIKNVIQGKTIYRILFQNALKKNNHFLHGMVLDLGSGGNPSYYRYINTERCTITKTDYEEKPGVDKVVDFNQIFPFADSTFDTVCIFHALYIAKEPMWVLREAKRVLKNGGHLMLSMPFVANEMPQPHDYHRYTLEGLDLLISAAGLVPVVKERVGERFTASAYIKSPFYFFWPIKLIAYSVALVCDSLIPKKLRHNYPLPIGYFYVARK